MTSAAVVAVCQLLLVNTKLWMQTAVTQYYWSLWMVVWGSLH